MALLYSQKGDLKKAEEWFDYARKAEPESARVRASPRGMAPGPGPRRGRAFGDRGRRETRPGFNGCAKLRGLIAWYLRDLGRRGTDLRDDAPGCPR